MSIISLRLLFSVGSIVLLSAMRRADGIDCYVCDTYNIKGGVAIFNTGYQTNPACILDAQPSPVLCDDSNNINSNNSNNNIFIGDNSNNNNCVRIQSGCQSCTTQVVVSGITIESVSFAYLQHNRMCQTSSTSPVTGCLANTEIAGYGTVSYCMYGCNTNLCNNATYTAASIPTLPPGNTSANTQNDARGIRYDHAAIFVTIFAAIFRFYP